MGVAINQLCFININYGYFYLLCASLMTFSMTPSMTSGNYIAPKKL